MIHQIKYFLQAIPFLRLNEKMRFGDGWSCSFSKIQRKGAAPPLPPLRAAQREICPWHCPILHVYLRLALTLLEWLLFSVFSDIYVTDLYDAFIESNKKEDPAERMWSIRSVVSVFVCM